MDKDGYLSLTDSGLAVARKIYDRHRLLTDFLVSLGVDREIASADACKIEHHISDEIFDALKRYLENIKTSKGD
jgi:Mn-dependent DtxR family transcriptional regulator